LRVSGTGVRFTGETAFNDKMYKGEMFYDNGENFVPEGKGSI
jgi:hypothetical protein